MSDYNYNAAPNRNKGKSIVGMVLAIIGLCLCWMGLFYGYWGILPLVLCIVGMNLAKGVPAFARTGKICGIIGLVLSIIFMIIGFVLLMIGAAIFSL